VTQALLPSPRQAHGRFVNIGGAAGRMTLPAYSNSSRTFLQGRGEGGVSGDDL